MTELRADRFHAGVRLAALAGWLLTVGLVFFLMQWLARLLLGPASSAAVCLLGIVALLAAQPLAWWLEKRLLAFWPSGRSVRLEDSRVSLMQKPDGAVVDLARPLNFWRWRFLIRGRRGGRIPNGHVCLALRLAQGEAAINLYTFMPPTPASELEARFAFYEVQPAGKSGALGRQGREAVYLAAEQARWESGAELEPGDFETLLVHLSQHVPDFAAAPSA